MSFGGTGGKGRNTTVCEQSSYGSPFWTPRLLFMHFLPLLLSTLIWPLLSSLPHCRHSDHCMDNPTGKPIADKACQEFLKRAGGPECGPGKGMCVGGGVPWWWQVCECVGGGHAGASVCHLFLAIEEER